MTSTVQDFMIRLRKLDNAKLTPREVLLMWAISREPGMMGYELAKKLGYPSRSMVQIGIRRLVDFGFIEDRRPVIRNRKIPNDLYIAPAGEKFLADLVPA